MSIPVIAFFNNKGGVGKTSLVYHLAWMYADLGVKVLAADLDPQANLTAAFLDEDQLEDIWSRSGGSCRTIYQAVEPLVKGIGDIAEPLPEMIDRSSNPKQSILFELDLPLAVLAGDLALSKFEDDLSEQWPNCLDEKERAFRVTSAFWRILQQVGESLGCDIILIDIGPNLGAINRAALISADHVAIPLSPDLFSLQGLRNLGPTLRKWREGWEQRLQKNPVQELALPKGRIQPIGYIVLQHAVRLDRPVKAYDRWALRIPAEYRESVLGHKNNKGLAKPQPADDEHCLALLKHYRSLMPLALDARKPVFHLKPADGAIGAHFYAVNKAYEDFRHLAHGIARQVGVELAEEVGFPDGEPSPSPPSPPNPKQIDSGAAVEQLVDPRHGVRRDAGT